MPCAARRYREEAGGACGIWRHRNGVDAWFCKYSRGATGQRFWLRLEQLLAIVERELTRWCLLRLDRSTLLTRLSRGTDRDSGHGTTLDGAAIDGRIDDTAYRALWARGWVVSGKLREYGAARGSTLRWPDVLRAGGESVEALARVVAHA